MGHVSCRHIAQQAGGAVYCQQSCMADILYQSAHDHAAPKHGVVTVVGSLPHATVGQTLRLAGSWTSHEKFGVQLVAARCEEITPRSHDALAAYLAGSALPGALFDCSLCRMSGQWAGSPAMVAMGCCQQQELLLA